MSTPTDFIIPFKGYKIGVHEFDFQIDDALLQAVGDEEMIGADAVAHVTMSKGAGMLTLDVAIEGTVKVECDRCLDELDMPVETHIAMSVKYGDEESQQEHQEGEREIVFIPEDSAELDMSQIIYDYVCLSLPMQRTHGTGGCNPDAMKYYSAPEGHDYFNEEGEMNPFAALKDMFR